MASERKIFLFRDVAVIHCRRFVLLEKAALLKEVREKGGWGGRFSIMFLE